MWKKQNFRSLAIKAEWKCGSKTSQFWKSMKRWEVRKHNFTSLRMKTERKCGRSRNSDLWQSRQSGSVEAELHIFGNEDRVLVETPNFRSLAVKAEQKYGSETSHLWRSRQRWHAEAEEVLTEKVWKRNLRSLEVLAERSAERGTSDICQSRQSWSEEAELLIFGSQRRTEVRNGTTHL